MTETIRLDSLTRNNEGFSLDNHSPHRHHRKKKRRIHKVSHKKKEREQVFEGFNDFWKQTEEAEDWMPYDPELLRQIRNRNA